MSIRLLAQELYRLQREVDALEKKILTVPYEQRDQLKDQLRIAKSEKEKLRRMLDGKIDRPGPRSIKRF